MILAITFLVISVAAYSTSQAAQHGCFGPGVDFWGYNSYQRKYKDHDRANGPAFFGSTTFLVFITDGYHLMQAVAMVCLSLSFGFLMGNTWKLITLWSLGAWAIIHTVHYLTYKLLSR